MDAGQLQGWAAIIAAIGVLVNIILTHVASRRAKDAVVAAKETAAVTSSAIAEQSVNIQKIEVATNSMKDDLVKATGAVERQKGFDDALKAAAVTAVAAATQKPKS